MIKTDKRTKGVWLSYDLGVDGDYEGLYYWLDSQHAIECGDSVAFFRFTARGDFVTKLRSALKREVKLRRRDRIYAVYPSVEGRYKGRFLFGTRKRASWEGYAGKPEVAEDEPA